jgi:hypothetical protein
MLTSYRVKVMLPETPAQEKFAESQKHSFSLMARKSDHARVEAKAKVQAMGLTVRGVQTSPGNVIVVNAFNPQDVAPARARGAR